MFSSNSAHSHQPSDGISKVVFRGQLTDEEVESLNKRMVVVQALLADFLADMKVKDKGLCCQYVVACEPRIHFRTC
ncbi:hypothetical protein L1887_03112 [Cichorium endivia]|nr:hypothetical protein L1887_03112 [Cichorium endivia]